MNQDENNQLIQEKKNMINDKNCEDCIHYNYKECSIDGTYTSPQWSCILWEELE